MMEGVTLMRLTAAYLALSIAGSVAAGPYYGNSYALVVGIDDYRGGGWQPLAYARRDAEAVAGLLQRQGFQVTPLYDGQATKTAIVSALQTRLAPRLGAEDRVLVFFAGHGHTQRLGEQDFGYLVPYDGTEDSATYLSMEELQTLSEKMGRAKHQLFVLNACYGGLFGLRGQVLRVDPGLPGYLDEVTRRPAREFITAGGRDQQVLDGGPGDLSFFTYYLLEALGDKRLGDLDGDGAITFHELSGYLLPRATNAYQTPVAGALPGHGGGEFVFFRDAPAATGGQAGGAADAANDSAPVANLGDRTMGNASPPPETASPVPALWGWLGQHLWEIFSGIGTAAVVALLGWLAARWRRRGKSPASRDASLPPDGQPRVEQVAVGDGNTQVVGANVSQKVVHQAGNRSVHIGGSASGNVIVTGDGSTVRTGGKGET